MLPLLVIEINAQAKGLAQSIKLAAPFAELFKINPFSSFSRLCTIANLNILVFPQTCILKFTSIHRFR